MNTEITEYKLNGWVLYDGDCCLCVGMAQRFQRLLASRHLVLMPLQTPWVKARLKLLDSQLLAEMRLMRPDGTSLGGADALLEIARHFWWAWPLGQMGRLPLVAKILRAGYRWIARNRDCTNGACEAKSQDGQSRLLDLLPLLVLPLTALILRTHLPSWVFMWAIAFALYAGCKWLTYREAKRHGITPDLWLTLAYLLAWPGMDADGFLGARNLSMKRAERKPQIRFALSRGFAKHGEIYRRSPRATRSQTRACPGLLSFALTGLFSLRLRGQLEIPSDFLRWRMMTAIRSFGVHPFWKPQTKEWAFAFAKTAFGFILVWLISRTFLAINPLLAGWVGMIGIVFILHFGLFHILSLIWQRRGIAATPVMQNPVYAKSVAEFWGKRWNTTFHELAFRFTFRPLRRRTTPGIAALLVFGLSGLIHELVISLPARGGYGLPTLYFLIQGAGTIVERSRLGRSVGLGHGVCGWFFTFFITVTPVFWLFHPPFIKNVILPMLTAIGAI